VEEEESERMDMAYDEWMNFIDDECFWNKNTCMMCIFISASFGTHFLCICVVDLMYIIIYYK
jgi:hypothetical protein